MDEVEVNPLEWKVGELTMDLDILREGAQRPTTPGDVRRVVSALPGMSTRRVCRMLNFSAPGCGRARAVLAAVPPRLDGALTERIRQLIEPIPRLVIGGCGRCCASQTGSA